MANDRHGGSLLVGNRGPDNGAVINAGTTA